MQRIFAKDDVQFSMSEWFLAKITEAGVAPSLDCLNTPYAWEALDYCANGQGTQVVGDPDNFGTTTLRPAYPADPEATYTVPSTVLMRLRGTFDGLTIYEFINTGGGGGLPTTCFGVKSVSCSNNILMVTLADSGGCLNCSSGVAFYKYNTAIEVPTATNFPLPNNWSLLFGDLTDTGLIQSGDLFQNTYGAEIKLRITLQYYFTPQGVGSTQSRWAYIVRNGDVNDVPVASFQASNQTFSAVTVSNIMTLANNDTFQPYAFQDGGAGYFVGDPTARVPTTMSIERLCG